MPVLDGLGRPWAAFGPMWVGDKQFKNSVSREASSKNRTSLPQPSAAIGGHRRPSAPAGWYLSVGTGLPPQTPPDFLFVIYKVDVVGVYCSHTPEESADNCYSK